MSAIFTTFECDRCGALNATPIPIDKERMDLCGKCVVLLTMALLRKIPEEEQAAWLKSFKNGIIT